MFRFPACVNMVFLLLVGFWFLKEIFGFDFFTDQADFIFNLTVLFFALNSLFINRSEKENPGKSLFRLLRKEINLKKDHMVFVIIGLFFVAMLLAVSWDLPYHYHPGDDEYIVPSMYFAEGKFAEAIANKNHSQNPLYDNQHLMYYILSPLFFIFKPLGFLFYKANEYYSSYFFLARIINYCFASFVIFITYLTGKILFNRQTGLIAAFFLAFSKLFMHFSLFMRSDMVLAFFAISVVLICALKIKYSCRNYWLLGILLGLGTSLKPYMLLFILPILFIAFDDLMKNIDFSSLIKKITKVFAGLFIFFHFGRFYHNFIVQRLGAGFANSLDHAAIGHYGLFPGNSMGFIKKFLFSLTLFEWWTGIVFVIIMILSLFFLIYKGRSKNSFFLALTLIPIYIFFAKQLVQSGKFFLILFPAIIIACAYFLQSLLAGKNLLIRSLGIIFFFAFLSQTLYLSFGKLFILHSQEDVRTQASKWLEANISPYEKISFLGSTGWQKPYINRDKFKSGHLDNKTEYIVVPVSDFHKIEYSIKNPEKYKDTDWLPGSPPDDRDKEIVKRIKKGDWLYAESGIYKQIKDFEKKQKFLGFEYDEYFSHPASWELWAVNNPKRIFIYKKAYTLFGNEDGSI